MRRRSDDQRIAALKTFVTNTHSMAGLDPAIQDYLSSVELVALDGRLGGRP
jgi:hypothetical protein